ncbi:MAG: response regulator [Deltaproteobacteria bacterium]|jgi:DNA-binding NtrC family response regulator
MASILVIDDDVQVLWVIRKILEKEGHKVISAQDGEMGLQLYRNAPYDLVVTDMIMPNKSGINLISDILRDYPEAKIIAISGGGAIEAERYLQIAKSLGVARTLTKPFSMQSLLEVVNEALSRTPETED